MSTWSKEDARAELRNRQYGEPTDAVERLISFLQQNPSIRTVLSYKPLTKWHEVDVTTLPDKLQDIHFDTVESKENTPFPAKKYDAIIIPLFGFSIEGYRLGHGGGWYDKFLVMQPQALKIGVGYEDALVDFEAEPHDVRMDVVITEKTIRDFR